MKLELRIIDFLAKNFERQFTINQLAKELKSHYSLIHRVTNRLAKEDVLSLQKAGKAFLCSLNKKNEKTLALLSLAEIERKEEWLKKNKKTNLIIKESTNLIKEKFKEDLISVALFGSYAKDAATKRSDLDLLIISKKKHEFDEVKREIYARHGIEISSIILTPKETAEQSEKPIIKEIIKYHYLLYGAEDFIKLLMR